MHSHIAKWGNSLGIRIPQALAAQIGLTAGCEVEMVIKNKQIVVSKPKYSLQELLAKVDKNNLHGEIDFGASRGHEEW